MLTSVARPFMSAVLICDWPGWSCSGHTAIRGSVGAARGKGRTESGAVTAGRKIALPVARMSTTATAAARCRPKWRRRPRLAPVACRRKRKNPGRVALEVMTAGSGDVTSCLMRASRC